MCGFGEACMREGTTLYIVHNSFIHRWLCGVFFCFLFCSLDVFILTAMVLSSSHKSTEIMQQYMLYMVDAYTYIVIFIPIHILSGGGERVN